jgi:zinc/manganese transport system substrate-binding protein/zinc transport system substrate-binding protein
MGSLTALMLAWGLAQVSWTMAQTLIVSTTIGPITDMVQQVAGGRVKVVAILPPGSDPHSFEPRPSSLKALAVSKALIMNGVGLEPFAEKLVRQLPKGARAVELAEGQADLICGERREALAKFAGGEAEEEVKEEHAEHGDCDPHLWLDPTYGVRYVEQIREVLSVIDPAGKATYTRRAADYIAQIQKADTEAGACLKAIPAEKRKAVSQHQSILYFARRYQIDFVGSIADFAGQEKGVQGLVRLARTMGKEGVKVILTEPQFSISEAKSLAEATGAMVSVIYSDVFDGKVNSYVGLLKANGQAACNAFK